MYINMRVLYFRYYNVIYIQVGINLQPACHVDITNIGFHQELREGRAWASGVTL